MNLRALVGLWIGACAVGCGPNLVPTGQVDTETGTGSSGSTQGTTSVGSSSSTEPGTGSETDPDPSSSGADSSSTGPDIEPPGCWSTLATRAEGLGGIWSDGQTAVAVGGMDLLEFDGATWTEHSLETSARRIAGFAPDDLWLAGNWGLMHWDGEVATSMLDPKVYGEVPDVAVGDDGSVWALAAPLERCGEFGCLQMSVLQLDAGRWVLREAFESRLTSITVVNGEPWVAGGVRIHRRQGTEWIEVPLTEKASVNDLLTDGTGIVWAAGSNGIWSFEDDAWTQRFDAGPVHHLALDRLDDVWGLAVLDDGGAETSGQLLRPLSGGFVELPGLLAAEHGLAWLEDASGLVAGEAGGHIVERVYATGTIEREPAYERSTAGGTYAMFVTPTDQALGTEDYGLQIGTGNTWRREPVGEDLRLAGPVWGTSTDDVWLGARGSDTDPLLRFNGNTFTTQPWSPRATPNDRVAGVWGSSDSAVWVVGHRSEVPVLGPGGVGFIERWDGRAWNDETPDGLDQVFNVAGRGDAVFATTYTQLLQRTGDGWVEVELPFVPSSIVQLAVASAADIWLLERPGFSPAEPKVGLWHWNGADWTDHATSLTDFTTESDSTEVTVNSEGRAWFSWRARTEPVAGGDISIARFVNGTWEVEPTPEGVTHVNGLAATSDGVILDSFFDIRRFAPCE